MDEWLCNPGMGAERGIKGELVSTGMCACLLKHECYAKCYCKLSRRLYVACSSMNAMPNVTVHNQLGLGVCTKLKDIFILIYFTLRSNNW